MASATATSRRSSKRSSANRRCAAISDLLAYYASGNEEERLLTGGGILEFARLKILLERLLEPESRIADVGGGTGRYAEWLVEQGHAVELLDPVPLHVEQAAVRAAGRFGTHLGDARALPFEDASFDAVLLFGPLYHLGEREERLSALREAARVCRPGGIVAATAISRYAGLLDHLKGGRIAEPAVFVNVMAQTVNGRRVPPERRIGVFPDAYFHLPQELADELADAGLGTADIYAVQGLGWLAAEFLELWADPAGQAHVLEIAERFEREPSVQAVSPHLLAVAARP